MIKLPKYVALPFEEGLAFGVWNESYAVTRKLHVVNQAPERATVGGQTFPMFMRGSFENPP